ncbi:TM1266 family iron-only hydrogenase system putative regulator [Peptostreptococcus faecalis]|uniref:TM1266 family iron-only hydrogenase system putative regulator n=1 Tax=Peptostreptococcus faecalis TaxID=2045015 RepID=UPI000C796ABD|nr:TM1266 family iron-only hydrogenase system putative regulator [Peptostreptococcus faecalis]
MEKKVAVISAILEEPLVCQKEFNEIVSTYQDIVRGRMGIPFKNESMSVVSITVLGDMDKINAMTGKLGKIEHVTVKTAVSKKKVTD